MASEDADQFGHTPSLISLHDSPEEGLDPKLPIKCTAKTDQSGRMLRMIRVFVGCTGRFVSFIMPWLKYQSRFSMSNSTVSYQRQSGFL